MAFQILTVIGPDRPGLVRALASIVVAQGGSWLESRMARLAGQFAGIVLVDAPGNLTDAFRGLEREGLKVVVQQSADEPVTKGERLKLEVVGNDRPGIVRAVTQVLAECGINIEELTTHVTSGSFSGDPLFRAVATLRAPNESAITAAREGLEKLGNELMVDIQPLVQT